MKLGKAKNLLCLTQITLKISEFVKRKVKTMGSRLHSFVQVRLAHLLANLDKFNIFTELSLEIDKIEYKPDICVYTNSPLK